VSCPYAPAPPVVSTAAAETDALKARSSVMFEKSMLAGLWTWRELERLATSASWWLRFKAKVKSCDSAVCEWMPFVLGSQHLAFPAR
jgi:hypothetical protein